jgi:hypothetical protein
LSQALEKMSQSTSSQVLGPPEVFETLEPELMEEEYTFVDLGDIEDFATTDLQDMP